MLNLREVTKCAIGTECSFTYQTPLVCLGVDNYFFLYVKIQRSRHKNQPEKR
jgi:hypothetical protein